MMAKNRTNKDNRRSREKKEGRYLTRTYIKTQKGDGAPSYSLSLSFSCLSVLHQRSFLSFSPSFSLPPSSRDITRPSNHH